MLNNTHIQKLKICDYVATKKAHELFLELSNATPEENLISQERLNYVQSNSAFMFDYHAVEVKTPYGYLSGVKELEINSSRTKNYVKTEKFCDIFLTQQMVIPQDYKSPEYDLFDDTCHTDFDYFKKANPKLQICFSPKAIRYARFTQGNELILPLEKTSGVQEVLSGIFWCWNDLNPETILTSPKDMMYDGKRLYKYFSIDHHQVQKGKFIEKYYLCPPDTFFESWNHSNVLEQNGQFEISKKEYNNLLSRCLPHQRKNGFLGIGHKLLSRFTNSIPQQIQENKDNIINL